LAAYLRLATLYTASGKDDQALAELAEAAKASPTSPLPHSLSGGIYERKGDLVKAREAYEKALKLNPRFVPAANNLAWLLSEHGGNKDRALQLAQGAKQDAPDEPYVSDTLGWILYKRGVYQRAASLLRESAQRLPNNAEIHYHLGMAAFKAGDAETSKRALAVAVNSPQEFTGKAEARKALSEILGKPDRGRL
jgi:Flp pilus assembly protein TadD